MASGRPPAKHGMAYEDGEIALIYLVEDSPLSQDTLKKILNRKTTAISWINSWKHKKRMPPGASGRIKRQLKKVERLLGPDLMDSVRL